MADGSVSLNAAAAPVATPAPAADASSGDNEMRWFTHTRAGLCTLAALATGLPLAAIAGARPFHSPLIATAEGWAWYAVAAAVFLLPVRLLLLDRSDNMARGPGMALPLSTLALLALLAAVTALAHAGLAPRLEGPALIAFFAALAVALIPPVWSAANFAAYKQREIAIRQQDAARRRASASAAERARADELEQAQSQHDAAESLGAVIATIGVGLVVGLAWLASLWRAGSGLESRLGVAICAGVIGLFAVVVLLKWIADLKPVRAAAGMMRGLSRRMAWLAHFYNAIDAVLVRIGAHAAGMQHRTMAARYGVLGVTLLSLAVMAWHLPAPWGLVPAGAGFLLALSVSRLWSWVEDDRNLAAITRFNPDAPQRVGFREDYRDEAIFGFIFVLVLIPIAMAQANASNLFGPNLFAGETDKFTEWLAYLGFELSKALPVVDWADIYNLKPGDSLIHPTGVAGMHAVFAARVTVDLILIASLLQAIGIATRNRQQKTLYAAGHIDRLDALVERHELHRQVRGPRADWFKGPVDFRRYNKDRLKDIYHQSESPLERAYIREIFTRGGHELETAIVVLVRLSETTRNEGEMHRTLDAVVREHFGVGRKIEPADLMEVMVNLRAVSGLKDLKIEIMNILMRMASPHAAAELLMFVIAGPSRDQFKYTRIEAARLLRNLAPKLADAATLEAMIGEIEADRASFGQAVAQVDQLLAALRKRLEELRPAPAAPSRSDQNKP